jgi:hypothetical protein
MTKPALRILSTQGIHPVLVDVGASGKPPSIWNSIATISSYVGFDPDLREIHEDQLSGYYKKIMVNKAVTADASATTTKFYLTASPFCSSTLKPNPEALAPYIYADEYLIEDEAVVGAVTLQEVIRQLALGRLDWLKLDTQGTDLQIFQSLEENTRAKVLALDIEPGMTGAYQNEDMFGDAHAYLIANGFWLSDLNPLGTTRLRKSTWDKIGLSRNKFEQDFLKAAFRTSPCWCEARYFRTIEWLQDHNAAEVDYILLWSFALLDNQIGFALDVGAEYEAKFGANTTAQSLWDEAQALLQSHSCRLPLTSPTAFLKLVLPAPLKRVLKRVKAFLPV